MSHHLVSFRYVGILFGLALIAATVTAFAADHSDVPHLGGLLRNDAAITDLHVFRRDDKLVLSLSTNPAIPPSVTSYRFASDLTLRFHIDNHSEVQFDDPADLLQFGGTIVRPQEVSADILIEITFDKEGRPRIKTGLSAQDKKQIQLFAGLRDDPFIRRPRAGRNVAAVVVELPLDVVVDEQETLLVWATSKVPNVRGAITDHAGRSLRSMFIEAMNSRTPSEHWRKLALAPDVAIFDTASDAAFPNGRALTDDVVDLVVDIPGGMLPGEGPTFPTMNDVPFLEDFPYLAPPHLPD
jgi:hypothetical protein